MKRLITIIALLCLAGPRLRVEAAIINVPITNYSFETPNASGSPFYTVNGITPTPGWNYIGGGGSSGVDYGPGFGYTEPDGVQDGWAFQSTLWQTTSALFQPALTYQLTLSLAQYTFNATTTATYALYSGSTLAGGTLLKSVTVSPPATAQTFAPVTLTFGSSDPGYASLLAGHAGENIIVALTGAGGSTVLFDNVQLLEIIPVPEPSTVLLLGVGGMLVAMRHRGARAS